MSALSEDARRALLAVYASIDAEDGEPLPGESADFARGFSTGLELALVNINMALNADQEPDAAWIAEGWSRLKAAMDKAVQS